MKHVKLLFIVLGLLAVFIIKADQQLICPTPLPQKYQSIAPGKKFVAYFTSWNVYSSKYQVEDIEPIAGKITHLIYAFAKPDAADGTCTLHDPWGDVGALHGYKPDLSGNFAKLLALKKKFPHLKVLLAVGGGTYSQEFLEMIKNRSKLDRFAQSCVDLLDQYVHDYKNPDTGKTGTITYSYSGLFDGIDIDWEWSSASVNQEQSESYTYFIKQLRKVLDDKQKRIKKSEKYILSAALQASPGVYQSLNFTALSKHVDWFNFMAYDFFGPSSGIVALHTPICGNPTKYSLDGALHGLFEQGLSPDKIVLGIPSYGYIYDNTMGMKATFAKNDNTKAISFAIIQQKYAKDRRFIKRWHDVERVPSLYSSIEKTFISYDDIRSVNQKVGFSKQNRLAGVMLWNLAGDDERHTLVSAITHALQV